MTPTPCPRCWTRKLEPGSFGVPCIYCCGTGEVDGGNVSEHFSLQEVWGNPHYVDKLDGRLKTWDFKSPLPPGSELIPNDPTADQAERARALAQKVLEQLRAGLGCALEVTSWLRQRALDGLVAGPPFDKELSGHSIGAAADVIPLAPNMNSALNVRERLIAALEWLQGHAFQFDQVIIEGGCLHVAIEAPYPIKSPGLGLQRRQALVRMHGPTGGFIYAKYDGSDAQLALIA